RVRTGRRAGASRGSLGPGQGPSRGAGRTGAGGGDGQGGRGAGRPGPRPGAPAEVERQPAAWEAPASSGGAMAKKILIAFAAVLVVLGAYIATRPDTHRGQ